MAALTVQPAAVSGSVAFRLISPDPGCAHLAGFLINTWQVDLRYKLDGGWDVGVVVATVDVQAVDAVLMGALMPDRSVRGMAGGRGKGRGEYAHVRWSQNGSVPI